MAKIVPLPTGDSTSDRWQAHVAKNLNPVLTNPALNMSDWRLSEGAFPKETSPVALLIQRRTAPDQWKTVAYFDATGYHAA